MRDKQQVGQQFSRAASSYDQAAEIQAYAVEQLIQTLRTHTPGITGHWLDIGCGTGAAFEPLYELGAEQITGLDLAEGMLEYAQLRHKDRISQGKLKLSMADADQLPLDSTAADSPMREHSGENEDKSCANTPRGIIISLMLQWSEDPLKTLREWQRVLEPNGIVGIATLLPGTHQEIEQTWRAIDDYRHVNRFEPLADLLKAITEAGFELIHQKQEIKVHEYPDVPSLLRGLKAIGATNVNSDRRPGLTGRKLLRLFEQHYPKNPTGHCPLSYHLCWIIAQQSDGSSPPCSSRMSKASSTKSTQESNHAN
ncbi:MAG: methyltransferase domain-containing protein [Oceanobacter sp.]